MGKLCHIQATRLKGVGERNLLREDFCRCAITVAQSRQPFSVRRKGNESCRSLTFKVLFHVATLLISNTKRSTKCPARKDCATERCVLQGGNDREVPVRLMNLLEHQRQKAGKRKNEIYIHIYILLDLGRVSKERGEKIYKKLRVVIVNGFVCLSLAFYSPPL